MKKKNQRKKIDMKKIASLLAAICALAVGIQMLVFTVAGRPIPEQIWVVFTIVCLTNTVLITEKSKKSSR